VVEVAKEKVGVEAAVMPTAPTVQVLTVRSADSTGADSADTSASAAEHDTNAYLLAASYPD
jgi:hypothetical protein